MRQSSRLREARNLHRALVTRSHPARTFAGLAVFTALLFLFSGIYLIAKPLLHPVEEQDIGVIAGAFTIALASILLFYLVKPAPGHQSVAVKHRERSVPSQKQSDKAEKLVLEPVSLKKTRVGAIRGYARGMAGK